MIHRYVTDVQKGKVDAKDIVAQAVEHAKKLNEKYHFMNTFVSETDLKKQLKTFNKKGKLAGVPISVKDCICVEGTESTAGSKILKGYKPVFDATVIERVKAEGAIIIGKTAQDEFGYGTFGTNTGIGYTPARNPHDARRVCGGSSSGSAAFTALADFPHLSIAESTGGSIAAPASYCGVAGLTPTYGRVSRYGLIDYANSLDKIGSMAQRVRDAGLLLEVMSGVDSKDPTTLNQKMSSLLTPKTVKGLDIAVPKIIHAEGVDKRITDTVLSALNDARINYTEVSMPLNDTYGVWDYYMIAMSETSTNLAKYAGMRYGLHPKSVEKDYTTLFSEVREQGFGDEAKRRLLLGTFARMSGYRGKYYIKAMKVRTKIIAEYKKILKKHSFIVSPAMPILPPTFEDVSKLTPVQVYALDFFVSGPNLTGMPHASVKVGALEGLPVGALVVGDHLQEQGVLGVAHTLERGAQK
ncbi:Asp-tRNA(Asn)/Glu-tRNA(Gln) amidotransferase subunit GatA [archaeon CG10_big_fil_rev_8_21_14_0_10_43_11]|nr:MAG: Asp-tRNA(Asn)/Glu-tRNA(Gln) amidotransferase subunit GatA [archaeon CG10_big_fil_rev_8_21_14_0_10_43_11]